MKVLQILSTLYAKVQTLDDFLQQAVPDSQADSLVTPTDNEKYRALLSTTLVASTEVTEYTGAFCTSQLSSQTDVVCRVVEKLKKKGGAMKNLLTFGFNHMSSNPSAQVSSSPSIEYVYPNQNISRLQYKVWETLLERVGDDLMAHLLETKSVFLYVDNGCYLQVTGVPLYSVWLYQKFGVVKLKPLPSDVKNMTINKDSKIGQEKKCAQVKNQPKNQPKNTDKCAPKKGKGKNKKKQKAKLKQQKKLIKKSEAIIARIAEGKDHPMDHEEETVDSEADADVDCAATSEKRKLPVDDVDAGGDASCSHAQKKVKLASKNADGSSDSESDDELNEKFKQSFNKLLQPPEFLNTGKPNEPSEEDGQQQVFWKEPESHEIAYVDFSNPLPTGGKPCPTGGEPAVDTQNDEEAMDCDLEANAEDGNEESSGSKPGVRSNTPFDRGLILYAKDLREKFPNGYLAELFNENSSAKLIDDVLGLKLDGSVENSASSNTISAKDLPSDCKGYLSSFFNCFCHKLGKLNPNNILDHQTSKNRNQGNQQAQNPVPKQNTVDETPSPNEAPQLGAPVFKRGESVSSQDVGPLPDLSSDLEATTSGQSKTSSRKKRRWKSKMGGAKAEDVDKMETTQLLQNFVSYEVVYSFVVSVIDRLVTPQLFGSKQNRKTFLHAVGVFIRLGRYEKFYITSLMTGIKFTAVPWLSDLSAPLKEVVMTKMLSWLLLNVVMTLLKAHFYITDTSLYRNRMFYYRKSTWRCIQQMALNDHLEKGFLKKITKEEAEKSLMSKTSLGVAYLRFLPKSTSLRPIVNMGRQHILSNKTKIPAINYQLNPLLGILSFIKDEDQSLLGSSVFGTDDIYDMWRQFVSAKKERNDTRHLYFVKVDIEGCYDSINQRKLLEIVKSRLEKQSRSFILRRYATVYAASGSVRRQYRRHVSPLDRFTPSFVKFVRDEIANRGSYGTVYVDQVLHDQETTDSIMKKLEAHIANNIVMAGEDYYLQTEGLSQGSALSGILCNYYYGHMERAHLAVGEDELLMRFIDDFLYVTPSRERAERFLSVMLEGVDDYNCKVNPQKTLTNFPVPKEDIPQLPSNALFPWCGMLFDPATQEVQVDYTRYDGQSVRDIFTLELNVAPGQALMKKMCASLKPKCHGMYLDDKINSRPVLIENAFKMFLLTAYKFHCYVRELPSNRRVDSNVDFFLRVIKQLPDFFNQTMSKKTKSVKNHPLTTKLVKVICNSAFQVKLRQHSGMYTPLLTWLKTQLKDVNEDIPQELPEDFKNLLD